MEPRPPSFRFDRRSPGPEPFYKVPRSLRRFAERFPILVKPKNRAGDFRSVPSHDLGSQFGRVAARSRDNDAAGRGRFEHREAASLAARRAEVDIDALQVGCNLSGTSCVFAVPDGKWPGADPRFRERSIAPRASYSRNPQV